MSRLVEFAYRLRGRFSSEAGRRAAYLAIGLVAIGSLFWKLQFSTAAICCGDLDGYYHIKMSQLLWQGLRQGHFPPAFTWLPLTTLNPDKYVDHHLLFHVLQIPFTWLGDLRLGAKLSAWLFASLALFSCYWLVVRQRVSYPLLWLAALLACSAPFLYRMDMAKAISVSVVFLAAGIHLLFARKYFWLLPLAFLFTLAYDISMLLGVAALIWAAVLWRSERRVEWRPVLWVSVGILAGFVINPYFPLNVQLFYEHLLMKVRPGDFSTSVGGEWYPYDTWTFFQSCHVACVAAVTGYVLYDGGDRKLSEVPLFFLIFSTVLLIINARWKRFAEYWPPFAVLFAAFALQSQLLRARAAARQSTADEAAGEGARRWRPWRAAALVVVTLALCLEMFLNARDTGRDIAATAPPDDYRAAMEWINANVPSGQMIFNINWDNFPKMFYYNTNHSYASGLDPTYLLDQHPDLGQLYDRIRFGEEENPAPLIRDRFGAAYVFVSDGDIGNEFYKRALDSGWFEEVYRDEHCSILKILNERRGRPAEKNEGA